MVYLLSNLADEPNSSAKDVDVSVLPCSIASPAEGQKHQIPASIYFKPSKMRKVGEKKAYYSVGVVEEESEQESEEESTESGSGEPVGQTQPAVLDSIDDTGETPFIAANLRGRQLIGRKVELPADTTGVILAKESGNSSGKGGGGMFGKKPDVEDEKYDGVVKCVGKFQHLIHYGHDFAPGSDGDNLQTQIADFLEKMEAIHAE